MTKQGEVRRDAGEQIYETHRGKDEAGNMAWRLWRMYT